MVIPTLNVVWTAMILVSATNNTTTRTWMASATRWMATVWTTATTALVPTNLVNVVDHHRDNAVYLLVHLVDLLVVVVQAVVLVVMDATEILWTLTLPVLLLLTLLVSLAERRELGQLSDHQDTEVTDMVTGLCRSMTDTILLKEGPTPLITSDKEHKS